MLFYIVPWAAFALCALCAVFLFVKFTALKRQTEAKAPFYSVMNESGSTSYIIIELATFIPLYVSDGVEKLFGIEKKSVEADSYAMLWCVDEERQRAFRKSYAEWTREKPLVSEFEFKNLESGESHFARASLSVSGGKYIEVRLDDIEEEMKIRRSLEDELVRVRTEEQHKSDFLSKMSHEIRTPMNGILGMMTLARNNIQDPKEVARCLDNAHSLAQFLLSLINDILDMSKIESGKIELENERFDFLEIYGKIEEMFAPSAAQKGIEFEMKTEEMDVRYVLGDSLRLLQTLINFVSNAVKYTPKGGKVSVSFRQMNKLDGTVHMLFKIKDNGRGMDPVFLSRIFKPFEQENAASSRIYGGTGLGMAIADNLVRLMGGHIVVDTALGEGSEFSVFIPFEIAPGDQLMDSTPETEAEPEAASLCGLRVLMAEDNSLNAEIAAELFAMEGAKLDIAENGKIAVEMVSSHPDWYYDIIFMDIQMPEMDGWTAAKLIREMDGEYKKTVPIFALSANAFIEDKRHSAEVGMNGHISKPIDFDELKRAVGGCLSGRR